MIILLIYIAIFIGAFFTVRLINTRLAQRNDFTSLKTVTFGDESAVTANRTASVISVIAIFLIWGAFTGSSLVPVHAPGPYVGGGQFDYEVLHPDGRRDTATVFWQVEATRGAAEDIAVADNDGFARDDAINIIKYRSGQLLWDRNDETDRKAGARIVAVNGQPTDFDPNARDADGNLTQDRPRFDIEHGSATLTDKGALLITPDQGWQMEPIWLPAPEAVWSRVVEIAGAGYQNSTLLEHLGWSLFRVVLGFACGALVGIPLGYAMGLSDWFRGWFDPIVEFMRPVPPLALIPLVIIWAGIGETGKIILLFLAALWIMTIAARAGVSGVNITKVHAAYSLGASRWQIMRHVIMPNSLPEIFTGARVAMGVCWGTVVAAELVAAEKGAGMMIMVASKFQLTDIVLMGIILIGIVGYGIDILMRRVEAWLVPWKGRG
ncbi:MAG: ABC transporter permease subunit [Rhodobacteraceae bacterium]|nr:ABC transporter permease subunit [Paracoccaceae bacterium]